MLQYCSAAATTDPLVIVISCNKIKQQRMCAITIYTVHTTLEFNIYYGYTSYSGGL